MDAKRTEAERAMSHFNITEEEWAKLSDEEKQKYIEKLPERGEGKEDENDESLPYEDGKPIESTLTLVDSKPVEEKKDNKMSSEEIFRRAENLLTKR
jgi:predicted Fe-S protein YdhL (DUF1289 family)